MRKIVLLLLLSMWGIFPTQGVLHAQDTTPDIEPIAEPIPRQTVYLIAEDAEEPLVTPERVAEHIGATVVHTWDALHEIHSEMLLDGIVIHASALDEVDPLWIQQAYRNGTVIAGIRMSWPEMADLVDDNCIVPDNESAADTNRYVIVSLDIEGDEPDEVQKRLDSYFDGECNHEGVLNPDDFSGYINLSNQWSSEYLEFDWQYAVFTYVFATHFDL